MHLLRWGGKECYVSLTENFPPGTVPEAQNNREVFANSSLSPSKDGD